MTGLTGASAAGAAAGAARADVTGTDFSSTGFEAQPATRASAAIHDSSLIDLGDLRRCTEARIIRQCCAAGRVSGAKCCRTRRRVARFVGAGTRLVAL